MKIELIGDKELIRKFQSLEKKHKGKVMRPAMRDVMKLVKKQMIANAPVRTGKLKKVMRRAKIRSLSNKRGKIQIGVILPTREELGIKAKEKGYYPVVQEYGSVTQNIPPQPWIRPAVDQHQNTYFERLGQMLKQGITKIFNETK